MSLDDLLTPAFFVTLVLAYLMPKLSPYIDRALSSAKILLIGTLPSVLRSYVRGKRLKKLRRLKEDRRNIAAINYQISKANSAFILFIGVILIYILLLVLGPFRSLLSISFWFGMSATLPIYIFEIFWLIQDSRAQNLVKHAGKVRVKNAAERRFRNTTRLHI